MHFRMVMIIGLLLSSAVWGSRKPAVEDFVGIEIEHPESTTPAGTESLVNLEKDIQTIETTAYTVKSIPRKAEFHAESSTVAWNVTNIAAIILLLGLPLLSWLYTVNRLRKKASLESASNVEVLEKYRKERENGRRREEENRKAS